LRGQASSIEEAIVTTTVTIVDEWTPGGEKYTWALDLLAERVTARELIRGRVYQEVAEYNARTPGHFRGLVQPAEAERVLNGYRVGEGRQIDWEAQFAKAVAAFERNGFILLVDDRQLINLDDEVVVRPGTEVSFLRLVPLVGG
jgi:hypothetical protein